MTQQDKNVVITALEDLKGNCTGIIAATIEDCQRVIGDLAEDNDRLCWKCRNEPVASLNRPEKGRMDAWVPRS